MRKPTLFIFFFVATVCVHPHGLLAGNMPEPDWNQVGRDAASLLAQYIRIDTQNPPGRTVEAADFLEALLRGAHLPTERVGADPEKPILMGRLRGTNGGGKPIVLLNHMDVVPADPTKWSFPPLSGEIRDGMIYGRGALDMKSFGIIQLMALRLLVERGIRPKHDVLFLAVPDEEVGGSNGVEWLSKHRLDVIDAEAVWDEGGIGITNALPAALPPLMLVSVAEKKVLWLRLIAEGPAGHGSRPFPEAAPLRLQQALERIFTRPPPSRLTSTTRKALVRIGTALGGVRGFALRNADNPLIWPLVRSGLQNDPFTSAVVRDTISLTMLQAGYKPNVIPERAEAVLDCRLLPGTSQELFIGDMQRIISDPAIRIEIMQPTQSAKPSSTRHALFVAIEAASKRVYPEAAVTPFMSIGATDSRYFRQHKVPSFGFIPVQIPKELMLTAHGIDERIPAATLGPAVRIVYEVLGQL